MILMVDVITMQIIVYRRVFQFIISIVNWIAIMMILVIWNEGFRNRDFLPDLLEQVVIILKKEIVFITIIRDSFAIIHNEAVPKKQKLSTVVFRVPRWTLDPLADPVRLSFQTFGEK